MFAVLPGRPRRTLEGVHSTTVPHTALKSILASLSVRNLHRVVCRGSRYSRWQNALSRPFVPSSESGVARYQWRPTKPACIRFVLSPLPISRPSRDTQPFRAARFSILAVLTPISLSLFRFFFFHPFFSRGEIEVSLSLSLPFFSSVVRCLADGTRCLVLLWTFQDSVGVEEFPVSNGRFLGRIIVPYENLEILQIRYFK